MFSLIISIIAIALVAALAAASVYYGGKAFSKGTTEADVSSLLNIGQQIQGAFTLAKVEGKNAATIDSLSNGSLGEVYLSTIPNFMQTPLTLDSSNPNYISITVLTAVCNEVVERGGEDTSTPTKSFACDKSGLSNTFYYKVK